MSSLEKSINGLQKRARLKSMTAQRIQKLHPASCFPPDPPAVSIRNRLFVRISPNEDHRPPSRLTFIGINPTTYSAIAALLASRSSACIDCINLFDACDKSGPRATLNDLQLLAVFNKTNIRLRCAQSYWQTKGSTIIIINVQHHQLGLLIEKFRTGIVLHFRP